MCVDVCWVQCVEAVDAAVTVRGPAALHAPRVCSPAVFWGAFGVVCMRVSVSVCLCVCLFVYLLCRLQCMRECEYISRKPANAPFINHTLHCVHLCLCLSVCSCRRRHQPEAKVAPLSYLGECCCMCCVALWTVSFHCRLSCLSVSLSLCLSVRLSVCLSVSPSLTQSLPPPSLWPLGTVWHRWTMSATCTRTRRPRCLLAAHDASYRRRFVAVCVACA